MPKSIPRIFTVVVAYAAAAMLSSHVSMDLRATDWLNLWTYFWWVVSLPVVFAVFSACVLIAMAIANALFQR